LCGEVVCVADPAEYIDLSWNGHCALASPAPCSTNADCAGAGQVCEKSGYDGYYLYVTERKLSGAQPTFPRRHFIPNTAAATVDTSISLLGLSGRYMYCIFDLLCDCTGDQKGGLR